MLQNIYEFIRNLIYILRENFDNLFFENILKVYSSYSSVLKQFFVDKYPKYPMTSKADLEKVYFHNYQKHARVDNPTFDSNCVNGSLTLFTPQKKECESRIKLSEYKSNFEPLNDRVNTLSVYQQQGHNYGRYSKQAFEKSKSYLSQYGSNLINSKSQVPKNQK